MPWQESVLLDRCEERNRGGGHHLCFCEHSHQDTRCRGCRWCQAGRFRRTWNCEIGYIDITSQPELSRPYISLQWCNDARMVLIVEEWAWRMFRSLRPQCRKGWKTVRSQEAIICIYGFLYVCIHYTLDTFQFQVCFSIGRTFECFGWFHPCWTPALFAKSDFLWLSSRSTIGIHYIHRFENHLSSLQPQLLWKRVGNQECFTREHF